MGVTKELIQKYYRPCYIETGSAGGDGIMTAVEAGCLQIVGIELAEFLYERSKKRFIGENEKKVAILNGKSEDKLNDVLTHCDRTKARAIIFLDAHKVGTVPGKETYPLLTELRIIAKHNIKNHTIMIDDVRLFGKELDPYMFIVNEIMKINRQYKIAFEDSNTDKQDVMVAYIRSTGDKVL